MTLTVATRSQNEYLASAGETGEVVLHKAGQTELDGFLTRFSLPARSVRFDPRGKRAVVTSDEVIAKVIDVKEPTKIQLLTGHSRSVREASWSPDGHFVVRVARSQNYISGCELTLRECRRLVRSTVRFGCGSSTAEQSRLACRSWKA